MLIRFHFREGPKVRIKDARDYQQEGKRHIKELKEKMEERCYNNRKNGTLHGCRHNKMNMDDMLTYL